MFAAKQHLNGHCFLHSVLQSHKLLLALWIYPKPMKQWWHPSTANRKLATCSWSALWNVQSLANVWSWKNRFFSRSWHQGALCYAVFHRLPERVSWPALWETVTQQSQPLRAPGKPDTSEQKHRDIRKTSKLRLLAQNLLVFLILPLL